MPELRQIVTTPRMTMPMFSPNPGTEFLIDPEGSRALTWIMPHATSVVRFKNTYDFWNK